MSYAVSPPPCILLLNGFPGIGKLSIARALQETFLPPTCSILIDNHAIIDIVTATVEKRTPAYYAHRKTILRSSFFDKIASNTTVLMTAGFAAEPAHDIDQWQDHVAIARERGFVFVHVNVTCEVEENERRLVTEERVQGRESADRGGKGKAKCIRVERLRELRGTTTMLDPRAKEHAAACEGIKIWFFELDNSSLTIPQSVKMLQEFLEKVGKGGGYPR